MINPNSVLNKLPVVYNPSMKLVTVADTTSSSILGLVSYEGPNRRTSELVEVTTLRPELDPLLYLVLSGFINASRSKVYYVDGQYLVIHARAKSLARAIEVQVHPKITELDLDLTPAQALLHQRLMDSVQFITYTLERNGQFLTSTGAEYVSTKPTVFSTDGHYNNSILGHDYCTLVEVDYGDIYQCLEPIDPSEATRPYYEGGKVIPTLTRLGYEVKADIRNLTRYYAIDPSTGTALAFTLPSSKAREANHLAMVAKRYSLSGGLLVINSDVSRTWQDVSWLGELSGTLHANELPDTTQSLLVQSLVSEIDKLSTMSGCFMVSPKHDIIIYHKWYQNYIFIANPEFEYAGITLREHCKQQGFI